MIFGGHHRAPASADAARWIAGACRGRGGTVGALVPNDYAAYLRVDAPSSALDDWWDAYRSSYTTIARICAHHTSTPDVAWFAIWDGYGWDTSTSLVAARRPPDEAGRRGLRAMQERLRTEDQQRRRTIRAGLAEVPRFELPHRAYHLVTGGILAVSELREPGSPDRWQRPDLFWPDDQRWFIATDVDFWSLYVGGTAALVDELVDALPDGAEVVTLDRPLRVEE